MPVVGCFITRRRRIEVLRSEVGLVIVAAFDPDKPTIEGGLDSAQAASGILVPTRPIQFIPVLIIYPELIVSEYQHRFTSSGRQEESL